MHKVVQERHLVLVDGAQSRRRFAVPKCCAVPWPGHGAPVVLEELLFASEGNVCRAGVGRVQRS